MRPSDLRIYELLKTKRTPHEIAAIINWKPESVRKACRTLVCASMVVKEGDGYLAANTKNEISIKAHNPFNL